MKIYTHEGSFHADEIFAVATLKLINPKAEVVRTRDLSSVTDEDLVVDVGLKYDGIQYFDHHQSDNSLVHPNGIPMAAFGLVWATYGNQLVQYNEFAYKQVEQGLVSTIDAADNGMFLTHEQYNPYSLSHVISAMNHNDLNSYNQYQRFMEAVMLAMGILEREIGKALNDAVDFDYVCDVMEDAIGHVCFLPEYRNFRTVTHMFPHIHYVVFPTDTGEYRVQSTAKEWNLEPFTSNNPDFVFCHKSGFIFGTKTKETALELLQQHGIL